ncbi:ribonuclease Z [Acinetobacter calcoaceticus]|uniref:Ribonuclease Z n=1 Tax=Acinetobacter calcoaceticus TaxID=471 RepID=A0A4R1XTQ0_ACICA|nr:ribonuclease Z [Acinetobacter calcoaceticus]
MLDLTFLGTSSGVPTLYRNVSALAVKDSHSKDWVLIDAGEGTQHRIQQAKLSLQQLQVICITHVHGDHCYGLIGLLASAGMSGRRQALTLIAPIEIQTWLEATMRLTDLYLPYPIEFIDVCTLADGHAVNSRLHIQPHELHHRVPSYAFSISATQHHSKLNTAALTQIGLPAGKLWGQLQHGQAVEWQGQTLDPKDFVQLSSQTVRVLVAGDNDQPQLLASACIDAALLVHESTYDQLSLDKVGPTPMHSSAQIVAQFAQQQHMPHLILTHFSPRHHNTEGMQRLADEVRQHYQGSFYLADDFDQYHLDAEGMLTQVFSRMLTEG